MSEQDDNLRTAYQELCTSYRAIDDFRAKLLGFLPLATAGGIVILLNNPKGLEELSDGTKSLLAAVGFFGVFITLGLFSYEIYGIQKCGALIKAGQRLEGALRLDNGQFTKRPQNIAKVINEPFASGIIYPAVLAAWTFFALHFSLPKESPMIPAIPIHIFIIGFVVTLIYDYSLRKPD